MTTKIFTCLLVLLLSQTAWTQKMLPKVVNISNNSKLLEELSSVYKHSLFLASDEDFVQTMKHWKQTLTDMEKYANEIDFDLKGVQMWMKVYWSKDGNIDHITYYLLDKSINIDTIELEAFLRSFIKNNKLPIKYEHKFSYDSRVMFPLYLMR